MKDNKHITTKASMHANAISFSLSVVDCSFITYSAIRLWWAHEFGTLMMKCLCTKKLLVSWKFNQVVLRKTEVWVIESSFLWLKDLEWLDKISLTQIIWCMMVHNRIMCYFQPWQIKFNLNRHLLAMRHKFMVICKNVSLSTDKN